MMINFMKFGFLNSFKNTIIILTVLLFTLSACSKGSGPKKTANENGDEVAAASSERTSPREDGAPASTKPKSPERIQLEPSQDIPSDDVAIQGLPKARIMTSMGPITIVLYPEQAPITVENFVGYVKGRHYSRTIFHRVIAGFMIQGGGFSSFLEQRKTKAPIPYEGNNGLNNDRGTIAMARTSNPNSATAQWYINHEDNAALNHGARGPNVAGYTVFGRVISGMNIVDAIASVETGSQVTGSGQTLQNAPIDPVVINNVEIIE